MKLFALNKVNNLLIKAFGVVFITTATIFLISSFKNTTFVFAFLSTTIFGICVIKSNLS